MKNNLRIIKTLTISTVILVVLLLSALTINLIKLATVSSKEKELQNRVEQLNTQIEENSDELDYMQSSDYIEKTARELLWLKKRGDRIFRGK